MGNLTLHGAEELDNQRAISGTVEVPVTRYNDAALALGARPNQQHEPAVRHTLIIFFVAELTKCCYRNESLIFILNKKVNINFINPVYKINVNFFI